MTEKPGQLYAANNAIYKCSAQNSAPLDVIVVCLSQNQDFTQQPTAESTSYNVTSIV